MTTAELLGIALRAAFRHGEGCPAERDAQLEG
jgi:hypothetical protein